jgi:hypothetical protein
MNSDDFEKQLERQPMRAVPPAWRAQILREAVAAVSDRRKAGQASCLSVVANKDRTGETPVPLSRRRSETAATMRLRELLWPRPVAWAGLAAAWVVIAILRAATPATPMLAAQQAQSSREALERFTEQRRELAVLLDIRTEPSVPQESKPAGPHSDLPTPPNSAQRAEFIERKMA